MAKVAASVVQVLVGVGMHTFSGLGIRGVLWRLWGVRRVVIEGGERMLPSSMVVRIVIKGDEDIQRQTETGRERGGHRQKDTAGRRQAKTDKN